ncbi:MAG TPA: cytidylate kinase-like family protein [Terriglobales bacterium]|jgi:cytidylate kinase|nr:cytidylate kinase-like family protein [Terriglobales bacterium]
MFRIITIEREYGSGAAEIAKRLASRLGWKLWDRELTEEIARVARVDTAAVSKCEERVDGRFQRLVKVFWRGSYERSTNLDFEYSFDADRMVEIGERVMHEIASQGNCVIVGRGAPYHLRERPDAFHVFLYAPRAEKLRRIQRQGKSLREAEELVETVDRERIEFVKHYFGADWPTRSLYNLMINTLIGNEKVIEVVLNTMKTLEERSSS